MTDISLRFFGFEYELDVWKNEKEINSLIYVLTQTDTFYLTISGGHLFDFFINIPVVKNGTI